MPNLEPDDSLPRESQRVTVSRRLPVRALAAVAVWPHISGDVTAAMHSPTALIFPARDTGNLTVRPHSTVSEVLMDATTNRAAGVRVIDSHTKEVFDFRARVVILAASALESTRLCCCRSRQPSERSRQLVGRSIFVSASCQNPTWTILALCWRAMDYLKDELRTGNLA